MIGSDFVGTADPPAMEEFRDKDAFGFVNLSRWELIKGAGGRKREILVSDASENCKLAMNAKTVIFVGRTIFKPKYLTEAYSSFIKLGNCFWIPHPAGRYDQWGTFTDAYSDYSKFVESHVEKKNGFQFHDYKKIQH